MFRNYLKIAFGQMRRHKLQAFINIVGLAVGLAGCLLIAVYVLFETSYDRYHSNAGRIHRVSAEYASGNRFATVSALVAPLLLEEMPEIEAAARMYGNTPGLIVRDDTRAYESGLRFADGALFRIFDFEWLQGDPLTALTEPNTTVLTESIARKYFGSEDPLGQTLLLEDRFPMTVTGVIGDLPENTHLGFSMLASVDLGVTRSGRTVENVLENWGFSIFHTYVLLREGASQETIAARLPDFVARHIPATTTLARLQLMDVRDIHLFGGTNDEFRPAGNPGALLVLAGIAACVLLIACINFMNLATARASQRAREIGIRKAMGAERQKIVLQFLGESLLMTSLALVLAVAFVELIFPAFAAFTGKNIDLSWLNNTWTWLALLVFVAVTALGAGSYPAVFLSAFNAGKVLKGNLTRGRAGVLFRNVLVLVQFSASIALIVATAVVYLQMQFVRNADLGFSTEQIVVAEGSLAGGLGPQWRALQTRLIADPRIENVAASGRSSIPLNAERPSLSPVRAEGVNEEQQLWSYAIGPDYFENYGMELLAGQTFALERPQDQWVYPTAAAPQTRGGLVLNLRAARELGWTAEQAIGKELRIPLPSLGSDAAIVGTVVGVVRDAWLESVREPVTPLYFYMPPDYAPNSAPNYNALSIRLAPGDVAATMAFIEQTWNEFNPDIEIRTRFLDQDFATVYAAEQQQGDLLRWFAMLAVTLACVGLLGLAAFNAERRMREIGVRKVMGGSVWSIVVLLTNDFSKLVLLANVIAWPIAYVAMDRWLENFTYRIDLTPLIFIASGLIALCVAWVTVGGTAAKAASAKPVLALRYE